MRPSATHRLVAADLRRQRALAEVLAGLAEAGVDALVIKGAALAFLVYEEPHTRPRCDADLLIRSEHVEAAERVLLASGYNRQIEPDATVISGQRHYAPPRPSADAIDLHWRVVNPLVFGDVLPFSEAWARSIPVPALGTAARTLAPHDALLLACIHRVAHHGDSAELKWLQDIDRLVALLARMGPESGRAFAREAARTRTRSVCVRSLELAQSLCGTRVDDLIAELQTGTHDVEPSAAFVGSRLALAGIVGSDLRHADWRGRARILREHLFPSREYMRARYPRWPSALMPAAYAFRIMRGAPAWFRRGGQPAPGS
jgi:hypothetical protein